MKVTDLLGRQLSRLENGVMQHSDVPVQMRFLDRLKAWRQIRRIRAHREWLRESRVILPSPDPACRRGSTQDQTPVTQISEVAVESLSRV
jgi:hypothetical protein